MVRWSASATAHARRAELFQRLRSLAWRPRSAPTATASPSCRIGEGRSLRRPALGAASRSARMSSQRRPAEHDCRIGEHAYLSRRDLRDVEVIRPWGRRGGLPGAHRQGRGGGSRSVAARRNRRPDRRLPGVARKRGLRGRHPAHHRAHPQLRRAPSPGWRIHRRCIRAYRAGCAARSMVPARVPTVLERAIRTWPPCRRRRVPLTTRLEYRSVRPRNAGSRTVVAGARRPESSTRSGS
jgi:hypothetical protein